MNYRKLGASELVVSEIAFGSWLTFSSGASRKNAIACVHRALDRGITLFDTANVYGLGKAEKVMGEALHGVPRDRYVLATKLFFPMSDIDRGLSCQQVHKQIDASLDRLQVSYVDLYQCHRYDERTPLEETMRALMPLCERSGISQIVWSPLAQGLLTGKYVPGAPLPASCRAADLSLKGFINTNWLKPKMLQAIQDLKPLAAEAGLTLAQFALAWVLRQSNVAAAIIGASRPEQIDENVAASGHALPPELALRAEAIIAAAS